jgi:hypothetical protein
MPLNISGSIVNSAIASTLNYKSIVTRGLVFAIDAASQDSYPQTGDIWYDTTSNCNTFTLANGPVWYAGNGGYFRFDGTNDCGGASANASNILTTFSADAWFRAQGSPAAGYHVIFQKEGGISGNAVYGLRSNPEGSYMYSQISYCNLAGNTYDLRSTTNISNNCWYYLATTLDSSYCWRIYVNGTEECSTTLSCFPYQNSSGYSLGTGDTRYTNGDIATVRTYNRTLSAAEIAQNFNAQKSRFGY